MADNGPDFEEQGTEMDGANDNLLWRALIHFQRESKERIAANMSDITLTLINCAYIALFTIIALRASPGGDTYEHRAMLRHALTHHPFLERTTMLRRTFHNISAPNQVLDWLQDVLLPAAYPPSAAAGGGGGGRGGAAARGWQPIGAMRLRQLRVRSDSCAVPDLLVPKSGFLAGAYTAADALVADQQLFSRCCSERERGSGCERVRRLNTALSHVLERER